MRRRLLLITVCALALILAVAMWWVMGGSTPKDAATSSGYTITAYDRALGNPKAPVVLIEYGALVCPHCAYFDIQNFPLLKARYIDTGKVLYVFRLYPIRPDDGPAEKLARCMPPEKYFDMVELLFRNQPKWDGAEYPGIPDDHAALMQAARIAGMTEEKAERCMTDAATDAAINQAAQEGEQRYGLTGTPTFIVNGAPGPAGEEWDRLSSRLEAALHQVGS